MTGTPRSSGDKATDLRRALSCVRSARAHIARGTAHALLNELEDCKRQGRCAALELRDALHIVSAA